MIYTLLHGYIMIQIIVKVDSFQYVRRVPYSVAVHVHAAVIAPEVADRAIIPEVSRRIPNVGNHHVLAVALKVVPVENTVDRKLRRPGEKYAFIAALEAVAHYKVVRSRIVQANPLDCPKDICTQRGIAESAPDAVLLRLRWLRGDLTAVSRYTISLYDYVVWIIGGRVSGQKIDAGGKRLAGQGNVIARNVDF